MMNKITKKYIVTTFLIMCCYTLYGQVLEYPQILDSNNQIIRHKGYVLSYNETCEQANWVKYMVTKINLDSSIAKRANFRADTCIATGSAEPSDYSGSGYDKGHLAPAGVFTHDQFEMNESFNMSNISPQNPSFNRGIWKKLEIYERKLAIENDTVYVITGGILSDDLKTIGENEVCVPKAFFKIIYTKDFIKCFIIENAKSGKPLSEYLYPISTVESLTRLKFIKSKF